MITFSDNIERKPYLGSTEIEEVWLGNIKIYPDNVEPPTPSGYENQYLTFEALADDTTFTFTPLNNNVVKYSIDNGLTWVEGNSVQVSNGNKVLVKGELIPSDTLIGCGQFSSSGQFNVYGNIMSLLFGDNFKGKTDLTGYKAAFVELFKNCMIESAENLILPATTLENHCYGAMFWGCTSLVNVPVLPATTMVDRCYEGMFWGCTSLVNAPKLPSTELAEYCYGYMFNGCTSLVNAPELPATTLAKNCYYRMFSDCSKLNYIKAMFTTTPSTSYTDHWVYNVSSAGTFVKNAAATWEVTGYNGIPTGWRVETASA